MSYANVVSTLALALALSMGGAYAHGKVGSWHIKDNAVKSRHIAGGAVKTSDLKNHAVATKKLKPRAVTSGKLARQVRGVAFASLQFQYRPARGEIEIITWFNRFGGKPTVTRNGVGRYTVELPGHGTRYGAVLLAQSNYGGEADTVYHSGLGTVEVSTFQLRGSPLHRHRTDMPVTLVFLAS